MLVEVHIFCGVKFLNNLGVTNRDSSLVAQPGNVCAHEAVTTIELFLYGYKGHFLAGRFICLKP